MILSDEGSLLDTLDLTFRISAVYTILYLDLYFNTAYSAPYVYCTV